MTTLLIDPLLAHAVADFGRQLGLSGFELDAQGQALLRMPSGLTLRLAADEEQLRVQIECPLPHEGPELLERALTAAEARQRGGGVQLGLRGRGADQVLLIARRLAARRCSGPLLGREFEGLLDWIETLQRERPRAGTLPTAFRS